MKAILPLLSILGSLCVLPSHAAEVCLDDATPNDCWTRLSGDDPETQTAFKAAAQQEADANQVAEKGELLTAPTGEDTGGANLSSTTKNFLPFLAFSGLVSQGDASQGDGTFVADLNFLLPGGLGRNAQLQAVFNSKSVLAAPIVEAVDDDGEATLAKQLTDLDDVTATFSYQWEGLNRGRSFANYRNRYIHLVDQAKASADNKRTAALDTAQQAAFREVVQVIDSCEARLRPEHADLADQVKAIAEGNPFSEPFARYGSLCGATDEAKLRVLVAQAAVAAAEDVGLVRDAIDAAGLNRFGELVDNQPQLFLTAKHRSRGNLVGGDENSGMVSFEWARTNLAASMSTECHKELEKTKPDSATVEDCAKSYRDFVADNGDAIENGNRFSFSFEFADVKETKVPLSTLLPGAGLSDLTLPGSKKRIWSLGWSRDYVGLGTEPIRLDLVANYDDVTGDPLRNDRLVASLTITRKINGMSVPLGIVYANHGEYLGEVDKVFSAHLGLKFDLFTPGDKTK